MAKSVKINLVYNLINTISGLLFPLLTFPYASRIMLADGIGLVNFYQSIISYITLLTCLGIPMYAIREIARVRDDIKLMNITAIEILSLHVILSILGYGIVAILCATVVEIQVNIPLFLILSMSIIFYAIGCEWFYQGLEDFKYITIRNLFVKVLYVVLLYLFVKSKDDLLIYGFLTIIGMVGNNIFNFFRLNRYIKRDYLDIKQIHPLKHLKPALKIFVLNLIVSIYINLNSIMLGFMADTTTVGLFSAASKISHMFLGISTALQNSILPRTSNLLQQGDYGRFRDLSQKVMDFIFFIAIPISVVLIILSPNIILVICGESFVSASLSLAIQAPIIFAISLSGLFGIQMLYPQGKEKLVIIATFLGAILNFLLNIVLIPSYKQDGASIATLVAEVGVTFIMLYIGRKYLPLKKWHRHYFDCIVSTLMMGGVCILLNDLIRFEIINLIVVSIASAVVYLLCQILMRNSMALYCLSLIKIKNN